LAGHKVCQNQWKTGQIDDEIVWLVHVLRTVPRGFGSTVEGRISECKPCKKSMVPSTEGTWNESDYHVNSALHLVDYCSALRIIDRRPSSFTIGTGSQPARHSYQQEFWFAIRC